MRLSTKRVNFTRAISLLIIWASKEGYNLCYDDVKAHDRHMKGSMHYSGLAADLNLYDEDWNYMTKTDDHLKIGEQWEAMGHTWGGRFKKPDGNHNEYKEAS